VGSRGAKPGDAGYKPPAPLWERILERITLHPSGCWLWPKAKDKKGYGGIGTGSRLNGTQRSQQVHRVAYEVFVGPIPEGMTIDHTCETKLCVNPEHLEPVTNAENKRRGGDRMKHCRRGHERNEMNTYIQTNGHRQCRVCKREEPGYQAKLTKAPPKNVKLTSEVAEEIRAKYAVGGISQAALGTMYGVAQMTISKLVRGESWC